MNLRALFQQFTDAASTDSRIRDQFAAWAQARRQWRSHWTSRGAASEPLFQLLIPNRGAAGAGRWGHPITEEATEIDGWRRSLNETTPGERRRLAEAFVHAVEQIERDPASIGEACAGLGRVAGRHGLPLAVLTPALSALDPNRFVAVCDAWLRPLTEYEGTPVLGEITEYSNVNTVAHRWLAAAEGDGPPAAIAGHPLAERFGVFCGWLSRRAAEGPPATRFDVTKKKYKDWPPMW